MALILHYGLDQHSIEDDAQLFFRIGRIKSGGVIFSQNSYPSASSTCLKARRLMERQPVQDFCDNRLDKLIYQAKECGLQTGIVVNCFLNKELYNLENFTAPVSYTGAVYNPQCDYYPVCPNNPVAVQTLLADVDKYLGRYTPDYLYMNHFQFPFDWENEDLDIQDSMPQFCYCPFCLTEFSSVIGEIVNNSEQIEQTMPEWLEWRTDSILNLIIHVKKHISKSRTRLIIGLPPLALIDLPFSTGLLPYSILDEGLIVSPQLYHRTKQKQLVWIEDILDQYRIDLNLRKIWPLFKVESRNEFGYFTRFGGIFGNLILTGLDFNRD